uniref:Uncharacterized protein n=2 Tax=Oryza brachyantha TaxID=4533 RepID=J3M5X8_ORYBR
MMKLHWDPHPGTTKKKPSPSASASASSPSSSSTSAVAKLLMRWRGRSAAAKDESIEFFSTLRNGEPDRGASDHAGRGGAPEGRGKATSAAVSGAGAGDGDGEQLLSTGKGKHDYDWLLTPPATPLWSPATSAAAGDRVAAEAPSRLGRASSASYAKGNSRLPPTGRENGIPASRLARSTSASTASQLSGRPSYGRTLSSASVSSLNTVSNASVSSTPRGSSSATSPRTPATARSAPAARSRHRDRTQALHVFGSVAAGNPNASLASRSRHPSTAAPT